MIETIPADLNDTLVEAVKEEIELGGDAGSVVASVLNSLADNSYVIAPAPNGDADNGMPSA